MKTNDKLIGILGLGSRSTLFYLETLNKLYRNYKGDYHTFPCIVYNVDFNTINPYLPDQFSKLSASLNVHLKACFKLPISHCIIPNITLHETYDLCQLNHLIIHPLKLLIERLKQYNIAKTTVFGSLYTMQSNYIAQQLLEHNIETTTPKIKDMQVIDSLRKKVYGYKETSEDISQYTELVESYSKESIILIACTELSILNQNVNSTFPVIDLALLQIEKSLELSV